jgi:hypothetical protein
MRSTYDAGMALDLLMIVLTVGFFVVAAALVVWLDWV